MWTHIVDAMELGIFPRATNQVTTFQMCNFPSGKFPKVRLGLLRRRRLQCGPSPAARTDFAAWEIAQWGYCHLGKYPWEVGT